MRRIITLSIAAIVAAVISGGNLAAAGAAPARAKPPGPHAITKIVPRSARSGGTVRVAGGKATLPAHGGPPVVLKPSAYKALRAAMRKPRSAPAGSPRNKPAHGRLVRLIGSASTAHGHVYWNGTRWAAPAGAKRAKSSPRLLVPRRPAVPASGKRAFPVNLYTSTQVDSPTSGCSNPFPNEPSVAQSTDNPNDVVVAAQAYVDSNGNCDDSHPWVFYSHDGGQHWKEEIMPGLTAGLAGGDVGIVYDSKHHVFVYSFLQFSRSTTTNSINTASSTDGVSWFDRTTLDTNAGALDKVMITVNQDTGSSRYGRVLVVWRDEAVGQDAFIDAFTDNGGASWTGSKHSVNIVPDCGNGASPAFDANGDAMVAWFDCNGGTSIREELTTDGGLDWTQSSDTVISAVNDIGSGGPGASHCELNHGGSAFRCDSFPSLAGDPNASDAGGSAFFVVFANFESTTQSGVTANVSQLRGLSTVNGGGAWNGGNFSFDYMAFKDFGDKFFPWAGFAPNGRLNVGFSDREGSAWTGNPNGLLYNEGQSEASSLTNLRAGSFVAYTADGTLGNPGSQTFIGDYNGIESENNNFDTFPVWTDVRNGGDDVRTMDLCYADCPSFLAPESPVGVFHSAGTSFDDLFRFNTDNTFGGAGGDFWNAVGIRSGTDGTTVDDDLGLWDSRYFANRVAVGSFGLPTNDYVLENDNAGHGPTQPYFLDVHNFSTHGGSYTVEWAHGHITLGTSLADGMGASNVIRVYDMSDNTGTIYYVGLRPDAGNTSNYRISVHLNGTGTYQGSNLDAASSCNVVPGSPAFTTVNTGSSPAGFDALVVQNNNGGSGTYTLYRDSAAPSGTVSINSGATYTKSTSVTLNLSASNPTSGDPVSDMRFSNDGSTFGAWVPFAASASYTLPAGDGTKTVFAEFRNGAGAVSTASTDSIILDTKKPLITKAPAPSFKTGHLTSAGAPIAIAWAGTDALSGIKHFDLAESVDGGTFHTVASPTA